MKTSGQIAFEAYNEAKGGKTYDGKPIPPWETLTDDTGRSVQRAWEIAAAVVEHRASLRATATALVERGIAMLSQHGMSRKEALAKFIDRYDMHRSREAFGAVPALILGREPTADEWIVICAEAYAYARRFLS